MPLKRPHIGKLGRRGFTIVELMIATSVLSTIILLVSIMMISIGNLYAKGLYQSRTQDTTRTITDQLAQDLKLNNSFTTGSASKPFGGKNITIGAYCIGDNVRYSFIVGYRLGNGPDTTPPTPVLPLVPHVLWRDDNSASTTLGGTVGTCKPLDLTSAAVVNTLDDPSGTEMMAPNSRLTQFCVGTVDNASFACTPATTSPFGITVGVAYGAADLLKASSDPSLPFNISTTCMGGKGQQFCGTAALRTTVTQRIPAGS